MNQYTINEHERFVHLTLWKKRILWLTIVVLTILTKTQLSAQAPPQTDPCERTILNFDGANDFLLVDGSSVIDGGEGTWEAWIRKDDWTSTGYKDGALFGNERDFEEVNSFYFSFHSVVGLHLRYGGTIQAGNMAIFRGVGDFSDTENFTPGSWHHIAATWKPSAAAGSTDLAILVDGVETVSGTAGLEVSPGAVLKFGFNDLPVEFLDGSMADIRIWDVARTATEITNDMNTRLVGNETNLTGYWPIDDAVGSTSAANLVSGSPSTLLSGFNVSTAWEIFSRGMIISSDDTNIDNGSTYDFMAQSIGLAKEENFVLINSSNVTVNFSNSPVFSLTGPDASLFDVNETAIMGSSIAPGQSITIPVSFTPIAEVMSTATLNLVSDEPCGNGNYSITLVGEGVINSFPVFETSSAVDVFENRTEIIDINVNDGDGGMTDENITYSIIGGEDATLFAIDAMSGELTFNFIPDFETPGDQGADNNYEVIVEASDGTLSANQTLTIAITDVEELVFSFEGPSPIVTVGGITRTLLFGTTIGQETTLSPNNGEFLFLASFDHPIRIPRIVMRSTLFSRNVTATIDNDNNQSETFLVPFAGSSVINDLDLKIGDLYPGNNQIRMVTDVEDVGVRQIIAEILPAFSSEDTVTITDASILSVIDVNTFKPGGVGEDGITYSIENMGATEGIDGELFEINSTTGALSFKQEPTGRIDADRDNNLQLIVLADDGPNVSRLAMTIILDGLPVVPLLAPIDDMMVNVPATLLINATATDEDSPTGLVFSIDATSVGKGMTIDPMTGAFSWTPNAAQLGEHTVTLEVTDEGMRSDQETFTITVTDINVAPVLATIADQTINVLQELTLTATATDANVPVQGLTYSLDATSLGKGMTIDGMTGAFSWIPTIMQSGSHTVMVTVTDDGDGMLEDTETFDISVIEVNLPPVITAIDDALIREESFFDLTVEATDPNSGSTSFTYALDAASVEKGMFITSITGSFSWTPDATHVGGDHVVTVTVTDNGFPSGVNRLSSEETFQLDVMEFNRHPRMDPIDDQTVSEGEELTFTATATDVNTPAQELTFSLDANSIDKGMTIDPATGVFSWTPTSMQGGTHIVNITVTDDGLDTLSNIETFDILVVSNQTITFEPPANKTFGESDFRFNATSSSGLAITYSSSNETVATITNGNVKIVGAGTTTITASQAGNANFNAAEDVMQDFTVDKADQTVEWTGNLFDRRFGGTNTTMFASASSGLEVVFTSLDESIVTISGNRFNIINAGDVTIVAGQPGNENYNPAVGVPMDLTILPGFQNIPLFGIEDRTFGDPDFDLPATSNVGLTPVYTSSDETVATIDGNTVSIVGAGSTTITGNQPGNMNYLAAPEVSATLTVDQADQTISFDALPALTVLDPDFDLMGTTTSGLDITYSSSDEMVATISGSRVTLVGPGTTTITASQPGDMNYNAATNVSQDLTISLIEQTITFDALPDLEIGDPDLDLMATSTSGLEVTYSSSNEMVATISGSTVIIVGRGTTMITASQAGDMTYAAAMSVDQELTVNGLDQTIIFGALPNVTVGDSDFALTATSTSGLGVTYSSSNEMVATISGNTVTIVGGGTTIITASQAGSMIYNDAMSVDQELTVDRLDQTITFDALPVILPGQAFFDLMATSSSGLPVTYTSSNPDVATISGSTANIQGEGTTVITASQAGDANYNAAQAVMQDLLVGEIWVWDGNDWNFFGEPPASADVILTENYTFSERDFFLDVNNLTINPGVILRVERVEGFEVTLRVNGDLTNNGSLFVSPFAGMITKGAITGTGQFQIIHSTSFDNTVGRYSVVGSPVQNADFDVLGTNALIYGYDQSVTYNPLGNEGLDRFKTPAELSQTSMNVGEGYFSAFTGFTESPGSNSAVMFYTGIPNSGTIQVDLGYTDHPTSGTVPEEDDFEGFNLVANPYPSRIRYNDFINVNLSNNIEGSIYLWDDNGSDVARGDNADYFIVNQMGNTNSRNNAERNWFGQILKGQGFFVKAMAPTTIEFNPDMQVFIEPRFDRSEVNSAENSINSIKLLLSGEKMREAMVVGFAENALEEIDPLYDAVIFNNGENSFYSLRDGKQLGIQGLPSGFEDEIPLGFNVGEAGEYTISLMEVQQLTDRDEVWLLDKASGTIIDISKESYRFNAESGTYNDRFTIIPELFRATTVNEDLLIGIYSYVVDHELGIVFEKPANEMMKLQLINLSGKVAFEKEVNGEQTQYQINTTKLPTNIYLLRIISETGIWKSKVLLK